MDETWKIKNRLYILNIKKGGNQNCEEDFYFP